MEVEILQEKIAKALNIVSRVASSIKTSLPVLNNVFIRVDNNQVSLTATNLEIATVNYVPAKVVKNGVITVPAKLLTEFVSNLPKGKNIKLKVKDNKLTIISDQYKSTINGTSADDFPELPQIEEKKAVILKIGVDDFKSAVGEVVVASSNDTTRPALTGVYFNTYNNALYIASTDGYRLAEKRLINKVESDIKIIVPATSLQEVIRSLSDDIEEIEILFDEAQVRFRLGEIEITSKLIDGNFPDYRQLIPKKVDIEATLDKNELMRVVKLAALFAKEVGGSIICETNISKKSLKISSVANEYGENSSEIKAEVSEDGKVTINSRFLIDAINAIEDEELVFGFSSKLAPVTIKNIKKDGYLHIIMPLKS